MHAVLFVGPDSGLKNASFQDLIFQTFYSPISERYKGHHLVCLFQYLQTPC